MKLNLAFERRLNHLQRDTKGQILSKKKSERASDNSEMSEANTVTKHSKVEDRNHGSLDKLIIEISGKYVFIQIHQSSQGVMQTRRVLLQ